MTEPKDSDRHRDANEAHEQREGPIARAIETETAKLPSDAFLFTAGAAMATSLTLMLAGRTKSANFIGHWVPTILICGLYNKLVKVQGHDAKS